VQPETLGLLEQAIRFAQAPFVFGPSGSGMLNATFSRPGTRVLDLESFTNNVRQHAKVYASADCSFSFLFGDVVSDEGALPIRPWKVDMDLLCESLDWLMA
jgi:capsular polysaccharide biosynthesis protein